MTPLLITIAAAIVSFILAVIQIRFDPSAEEGGKAKHPRSRKAFIWCQAIFLTLVVGGSWVAMSDANAKEEETKKDREALSQEIGTLTKAAGSKDEEVGKLKESVQSLIGVLNKRDGQLDDLLKLLQVIKDQKPQTSTDAEKQIVEKIESQEKEVEARAQRSRFIAFYDFPLSTKFRVPSIGTSPLLVVKTENDSYELVCGYLTHWRILGEQDGYIRVAVELDQRVPVDGVWKSGFSIQKGTKETIEVDGEEVSSHSIDYDEQSPERFVIKP